MSSLPDLHIVTYDVAGTTDRNRKNQTDSVKQALLRKHTFY